MQRYGKSRSKNKEMQQMRQGIACQRILRQEVRAGRRTPAHKLRVARRERDAEWS